MKKTALLKTSAFLITLLMSISLCMMPAFAADGDELPVQEPLVQETPAQEASEPEVTVEETGDTIDAALAASSDEKLSVAEFKSQILALVNAERQKAGVAPLAEMAALAVLADTRAEESNVKFSHTRPNGTLCFTILKENAMRYRTAGENLAFGFNTPEDFVQAWMNSPSHRSNLLDTDFKLIGIGFYESNETGKIYCSQLFYTPKYATY